MISERVIFESKAEWLALRTSATRIDNALPYGFSLHAPGCSCPPSKIKLKNLLIDLLELTVLRIFPENFDKKAPVFDRVEVIALKLWVFYSQKFFQSIDESKAANSCLLSSA